MERWEAEFGAEETRRVIENQFVILERFTLRLNGAQGRCPYFAARTGRLVTDAQRSAFLGIPQSGKQKKEHALRSNACTKKPKQRVLRLIVSCCGAND